jgi:hypothetical protein
MTADLFALCLDVNDPLRLARFWAGVLGRELASDPAGASRSCRGNEFCVIEPGNWGGPPVRPKTGKDRDALRHCFACRR